jgi:RHS repeat-associated protein
MSTRVIATLCLLLLPVIAAAQAPVTVEYYHLDAVGSVRVVSDKNGAEVRSYAYRPFGEGDGTTGATDALRFSSKERDAETGLDYFGARYYASRTGRFTTVDPVLDVEAALTDPQRWNRYAYTLNNPLKFADPDGRNPVLIKLLELAQRAASSPAAQRAQQAIVNQGSRAWVALTRLFNTPQGQELVQTAAEVATGADLGPAGLPFRSGDVIAKDFATGVGTVSMMAEAVISGKTLHLKDIAVYPKDAEVLQVGTKGMLELLQKLKVEAQQLGFKQLRITGLRFSGANPGKEVDLLIDLTEDIK